MTSFYHPNKSKVPLPHILGLSASPVMRSDPRSLNKVEEILDAVCRTPKVHQADLRFRVKLPVLSIVDYVLEQEHIITKTIASFGRVIQGLDILEDPYVISLKISESEKGRRELIKVLRSHKTYSQIRLRAIYDTSRRILLVELGAWAADYYISAVVKRYSEAMTRTDVSAVMDTTNVEKVYIFKALKNIDISPTLTLKANITNKVEKLIEILVQQRPPFSAIIFVQERATVFVLSHLLSQHPLTKGRYKIGIMVGMSSNSKRTQNIGDLVDLDDQKDTLSLFKSGKIDILIATNVLEEGIDVSACNLVICFR